MLYDTYEMFPKPMAEIGGRPILWHIMKHYATFGFQDFIICTGYKGDIIKDYFMNYYIYQSDITIDLMTNQVHIHKKKSEDWKVTIVDTGMYAPVTERIIQIQKYLMNESFIVNYGDCVSDVNIEQVVKLHREKGKQATMVLATPAGRNKAIPINMDGKFTGEINKKENTTWADASMMVFEPEIFEYLTPEIELLKEPMLSEMVKKDELIPYFHFGYWAPMETKRDQGELEQLWKSGKAPWKNWDD